MIPDVLALYVGPDQMMPLASIFATIAGFLLIFWNKVLDLLRKIGLFRRSANASDSTPPEKPTPPQA